MSDFSLGDLHNLLTCVNESIQMYNREILEINDYACKNVLTYTLERDLKLAKKIEDEIVKIDDHNFMPIARSY